MVTFGQKEGAAKAAPGILKFNNGLVCRLCGHSGDHPVCRLCDRSGGHPVCLLFCHPVGHHDDSGRSHSGRADRGACGGCQNCQA